MNGKVLFQIVDSIAFLVDASDPSRFSLVKQELDVRISFFFNSSFS